MKSHTLLFNHQLKLVLLALCFLSGNIHASEIDKLLATSNPPPGIVFEIVEEGPEHLGPAIDWVNKSINQLRKKHPQMEFAVVSHGPEQFALQKENSSEFKTLHNSVRNMNASGIEVHICETFAGWHGVNANQFPDYVNVAATGPSQINNLVNLGYKLIRVTHEMD